MSWARPSQKILLLLLTSLLLSLISCQEAIMTTAPDNGSEVAMTAPTDGMEMVESGTEVGNPIVEDVLPPSGKSLREGVLAMDAKTKPSAKGSAALISGLDFKQMDRTGRSRLLITANKALEPQIITKDGGRTVILSVSPANIAENLMQPLDTTYFQSAVDFIKPARAKGRSVDFMIRLREVVPLPARSGRRHYLS